jgi:hypothetical protein
LTNVYKYVGHAICGHHEEKGIMQTLRDRALAAESQREEVYQAKRVLRLKEEIQKILGITVEPTVNLIQVEGYWFSMGNDGFAKVESLMVSREPPTEYGVSKERYPIRSLADLGDTIRYYFEVADEETNV